MLVSEQKAAGRGRQDSSPRLDFSGALGSAAAGDGRPDASHSLRCSRDLPLLSLSLPPYPPRSLSASRSLQLGAAASRLVLSSLLAEQSGTREARSR